MILKVLVALSESINGSGNKVRRAGEFGHRQTIPQVFFQGLLLSNLANIRNIAPSMATGMQHYTINI